LSQIKAAVTNALFAHIDPYEFCPN